MKNTRIIVYILTQPDLYARLFNYLGVDDLIHLSRVNKSVRCCMKKLVNNLHRFDYYELLLVDCPNLDKIIPKFVSKSIIDRVCQNRQLQFSFTVESRILLLEIISHRKKIIQHTHEMLLAPDFLVNCWQLELPSYFSSSGYQNRYFFSLRFDNMCYLIETTNIRKPIFTLLSHSIPFYQSSPFYEFFGDSNVWIYGNEKLLYIRQCFTNYQPIYVLNDDEFFMYEKSSDYEIVLTKTRHGETRKETIKLSQPKEEFIVIDSRYLCLKTNDSFVLRFYDVYPLTSMETSCFKFSERIVWMRYLTKNQMLVNFELRGLSLVEYQTNSIFIREWKQVDFDMHKTPFVVDGRNLIVIGLQKGHQRIKLPKPLSNDCIPFASQKKMDQFKLVEIIH